MCILYENKEKRRLSWHQGKVSLICVPRGSEPDTMGKWAWYNAAVLLFSHPLWGRSVHHCLHEGVTEGPEDEKGRLEWPVPCMEDWHTKVVLLEVNWKQSMPSKSIYYVSILCSCTLLFLAFRWGGWGFTEKARAWKVVLSFSSNLLKYSAWCTKNMNATRNFVQVMLSGRIITASVECFGGKSKIFWYWAMSTHSPRKQRSKFNSIKFLGKECTNIALPSNKHQQSKFASNTDSVEEYAKQFFS